jgi:hypothetical protein
MGEKLKFLQAKIVGTGPKVKQMLIGQNDKNFI